MYSIEQVLSSLNESPTKIAILAILVFTIGFVQYFEGLRITIRDKRSPLYFWQHAWYFGHDLTFLLLFPFWFFTVDHWLFKILCIGCGAFVLIELLVLHLAVKYERQQIWGRYYDTEVSPAEAWKRGILSYAIGFTIFYTVRLAINDTMCLALMMSTNATVAIAPAFLIQERRDHKGTSTLLAALILTGTAYTFMPPNIGLFTTLSPTFHQPWFYSLGALCLCSSAYYFTLSIKYSRKAQPSDTRPAAPSILL